MAKVTFAEVLFNLHIIIFLLFFIPFLIPLSIWPSRIEFHFWYIVLAVASELITGLILMPWMKKYRNYRIVCPLTTWMQYVRGYKPSDPRNFDHGFVSEFLGRAGIKVPRGTVTIINFTILIIVLILYLSR